MSEELFIFIQKYRCVKEYEKVIKKTHLIYFDSLDYEVFFNSKCNSYQEYIRLNFNRSSYNVRNSNGNSILAIFQEIAKVINSKDFEEVKYYEELIKDQNWKKLDLNSDI